MGLYNQEKACQEVAFTQIAYGHQELPDDWIAHHVALAFSSQDCDEVPCTSQPADLRAGNGGKWESGWLHLGHDIADIESTPFQRPRNIPVLGSSAITIAFQCQLAFRS